mgnify:CR=1 FL=1
MGLNHVQTQIMSGTLLVYAAQKLEQAQKAVAHKIGQEINGESVAHLKAHRGRTVLVAPESTGTGLRVVPALKIPSIDQKDL